MEGQPEPLGNLEPVEALADLSPEKVDAPKSAAKKKVAKAAFSLRDLKTSGPAAQPGPPAPAAQAAEAAPVAPTRGPTPLEKPLPGHLLRKSTADSIGPGSLELLSCLRLVLVGGGLRPDPGWSWGYKI